jgi:hypothetical protein
LPRSGQQPGAAERVTRRTVVKLKILINGGAKLPIPANARDMKSSMRRAKLHYVPFSEIQEIYSPVRQVVKTVRIEITSEVRNVPVLKWIQS